MRVSKQALTTLTLLAAAAAAACTSPPEPQPPWRGRQLTILGANGRHLGPDAAYWLPLGAADRTLPIRTPVREALALRNDGDEPLTLESVFLTPLGDTRPDEFALLAPSRAQEVPLGLLPTRLAPGAQLDLDVWARLAGSGVRHAVLTARWTEGADVAVELRARGDGSERLWDPADPLPSWRLQTRDGGPSAPVAAAFATGNTYTVGRSGNAPGLLARTLVSRITPEGLLAWSTALEDAGESATVPAGLCVGGQAVVVVGSATGPDGRRRPAVIALGPAGALRWGRSWDVGAVPGGAMLRCSIAGGILWLAGVGAGDDGAPAARVIALAVRIQDAALIGAWTSSVRPGVGHGVADVVAAADGGSAVVVGGFGKLGYALRLGWDRASWYDLPGPAVAAAPLDHDELAVAWAEAERTVVARLYGPGATRWVAALGLAGLVRLASDEAGLSVVSDGPAAWIAAGIRPDDGAVQYAAKLFVQGGASHLVAVHSDDAGLWLLGSREAARPQLWYAATVATAARPNVRLPLRVGEVTATTISWWADAALWVSAWDATRDVALAEPPTDAAEDGDAFCLTGLQRPGSE